MENTRFVPGTHTVDYANKSVTENTRTAYPINFIANAIEPGVAEAPKNIFFLTADAFGVIPPISKLDKATPCTCSCRATRPRWPAPKWA